VSEYTIPREVLTVLFKNPRWAKAFEQMQLKVVEADEALSVQVPATTALKDATYVTLSANAELPNERVLQFGEGIGFVLSDGAITIALDRGGVKAVGGFDVRLVASGDTRVAVPLTGTMATRDNIETLTNKTLAAPKLSGLTNAADDTAAAGAGVPVGGVYRDGSTLKVRVA
jgi:hypothetical protein